MCCCAAALPQSTAIRMAVRADKRVRLVRFDMESSSLGENPFPKLGSAGVEAKASESLCPFLGLVKRPIRIIGGRGIWNICRYLGGISAALALPKQISRNADQHNRRAPEGLVGPPDNRVERPCNADQYVDR